MDLQIQTTQNSHTSSNKVFKQSSWIWRHQSPCSTQESIWEESSIAQEYMCLKLQEKHERREKEAHEEQTKLRSNVEMARNLMEDVVKAQEEIQRENEALRKMAHDQTDKRGGGNPQSNYEDPLCELILDCSILEVTLYL